MNMMEKICLDEEKKKIVTNIISNKKVVGKTVTTSDICVKNNQKMNKGQIINRTRDPKNLMGNLDKLRKMRKSPNLKKNQMMTQITQIEKNSVKNFSPRKLNSKIQKSSPGTDGKSNASRSNFHLSVLKSEKISLETQTKKSNYKNMPEPKLKVTKMARFFPLNRDDSRKYKHPEVLEDEAKVTVFKTGSGSNLNSLYSRK